MANEQPKATPKITRPFRYSQICLRFLVLFTSLAATWLMVTAKQKSEVLGLNLEARYTYSSAFKFFAIASGVTCGFSLLSLFFLFLVFHRFAKPVYFYFFFIHDLLMMSLVMAACGSATAISLVGKYGNDHTGWSPICDLFGKFCDRVMYSLIVSYLCFIFLLILTLISAWKSRQILV